MRVLLPMRAKGKPPARLLSATTLARSRHLRRNSTEAERRMWLLLHDRRLQGAKFRRQHPIGKFIADFCCLGSRLIVELDGTQHEKETHAAYDQRRTAYLGSRGFKVLSFNNDDVFGAPEGVLERIFEALEESAEPSP